MTGHNGAGLVPAKFRRGRQRAASERVSAATATHQEGQHTPMTKWPAGLPVGRGSLAKLMCAGVQLQLATAPARTAMRSSHDRSVAQWGLSGLHDVTGQPVGITRGIQARQQNGQAFGVHLAKLCHRSGYCRRGIEVFLRPIGRDVSRHDEYVESDRCRTHSASNRLK